MLFVNVKPSANIWKVMPENCTSLNFHKTKNAKVTWVCHPSSRPVTCDHCIGIVMFAEWKMIAKYITNWYFKYSISCYMLISESLNMQNLLNNRKLQKHQIHCNLCLSYVLISTNVQISDQNALHDSNQVLPCNRFFHFSARSNCPSPENFWLSIFHPPDIFISGKRPKTWFQWEAFYWFWTTDWL